VPSSGLEGGTIMSGSVNARNGINQEKPGSSAMRNALSDAWAWCVRLLYEHTALVLTIMFFVTMAGAMWHLSRTSIELVQSAALQGTSLYADALEEVRKLYTSEVVNRLVDQVPITHDYATRKELFRS
jgi:hypothetical protein